jgi:IS1 family transposase
LEEKSRKIPVLELDELYTYVKKLNKIRTDVDRNRLCFAGFEVGDGGAATFQKLWKRVKIHTLKIVCTDGNWSYSDVLILEDIQHVVSKSETCLIESFCLFSEWH